MQAGKALDGERLRRLIRAALSWIPHFLELDVHNVDPTPPLATLMPPFISQVQAGKAVGKDCP